MSAMRQRKIDLPDIPEDLETKTLDKLNYRTEKSFFDSIENTISLKGKEFFYSKFNKVTLSNEKNTGVEFVDCIFDHCDFSNGYFPEMVARRVIFKSCRMTGCDFTMSTLQDVVFDGCQLNYCNFSSSKINYVLLKNCMCQEAIFSSCKQTGLQFEQTSLSGTEFFRTSLKNVDFRTSNIQNIIVEIGSLKGSIMSLEQAAACAQLLGIIIKDDFH